MKMRVAVAALLGAACFAAQAAPALARTTAAAHPATTPSASHPCGTTAKPGSYKHIIWIFMENHSYPNIIGSSQAAYINTVAKECGSATNYHNITHPSLPNYIAATSGLSLSSLQAFLPDCSPAAGCNTSAKSIFGQVKTWRSYEENMPANCARTNAGNYAVRHNPATYFTALHNCSSNDVPYAHLATDLARNQLPQFSFITPNLIDDMHNGTTAQGSKWLAAHLPAILNSAQYKNGSTAIFLTWDEGEEGQEVRGERCSTSTSDVSCHIPMLVISPSTNAGTKSGTLFSHFSLLATTEQLLGLAKLGQAASAATMTKAFNL
jgi:phosphatidylinositol-3-phosphatase